VAFPFSNIKDQEPGEQLRSWRRSRRLAEQIAKLQPSAETDTLVQHACPRNQAHLIFRAVSAGGETPLVHSPSVTLTTG
jgi:hypothetical protein